MRQEPRSLVSENILGELEKKTEVEWRDWIANLLEGNPVCPDLHLGDEERDQILIGVFRSLRTKQIFWAATSSLLGSILPSSNNAEQLFFLLQAISIIRPPSCSLILQRYLEERRFEGLLYNDHPLDYLALSTRCDYASDDSLVDFLVSSFERRPEWDYKLLCFRQLSRIQQDLGFALLEMLLPLIPENEVTSLGRVLQGYTWRKGFRCLFEWYVDYEARMPADDQPSLMLREALARFVVPRSEDTNRDAFYVLLSARLHSAVIPFAAEDIVEIASTIRDPRLSEKKKVVVDTLQNVWEHNKKLIPQLATEESSFPWIEREFLMKSESRHLVETHWREESISRPGGLSPAQSVDLDLGRDAQVISAIIDGTGPSNLLYFAERRAA